MTKIVYKDKRVTVPARIQACTIPSGTLFKGFIAAAQSRFFVKGEDCILSLDGSNTGVQWENGVYINDYEPLPGYLDLEEV